MIIKRFIIASLVALLALPALVSALAPSTESKFLNALAASKLQYPVSSSATNTAALLAGHDEGGGEVITKIYNTQEVGVTEEKQFVQFYGMSSDAANTKHFGGLKDYRASEGREVLVPYRGDIANTVQDMLGGLRSACTYVGAEKLKHLPKCTTFIRCHDTHNRVYE